MPTPLRHPVHARELVKLLDRIIPATDESTGQRARFQSIRDWIADGDVENAVFEERDRLANLPIPTPVGDLIPGSIVDIKSVSPYGTTKRTIKGATVSANNGLTKYDPSLMSEVHLMRGGQSLRVKQREIVEIKVVGRLGSGVHGG